MTKLNLQGDKLHGLVFDSAIFLGNLAFIRFVPIIGADAADTTGGALLLLAVIAQILGAWWKRGFLSQRLAFRKSPPRGFISGFMNVLLFLHFLLFSVSTLLAFGLLGIYNLEGSHTSSLSELWVFAALFVGAAATFLVRRAGQPGEGAARSLSRPGWLEFGADGLLWVSVSVLTRIYWDGLTALIEPSRGAGLGEKGIVLLVAMFLLYIFFYLPGRYLFLVEDYRSGWTWVQAFGAMLPVVWLVIVG
jgi:hypothetical protein